MIKAPKKIDFSKLQKELEEEIEALIELQTAILEENQTLKDKKLSATNKLNLIDLKADIKVKTSLLDNYIDRVKTQEIQDKAERKDFDKNFKKVLSQSKSYTSNFKLPRNLREHLRKILKTNANNYEQKLTLFLTLKTENKMCENFIKNTIDD